MPRPNPFFVVVLAAIVLSGGCSSAFQREWRPSGRGAGKPVAAGLSLVTAATEFFTLLKVADTLGSRQPERT